MHRPGATPSILALGAAVLLLSGAGRYQDQPIPLAQAKEVRLPAAVSHHQRLPQAGPIDIHSKSTRHRATAMTAGDDRSRRGPLADVDLSSSTKQQGAFAGPQSVLSPALEEAIARLQDPRYMRGDPAAGPASGPPPRAPAVKGAAPWGPDRLLANPTDMNDEYVSLAVDPVSGFLFAVFAATDLGGTDRDVHIARSMDLGRTWTSWEMPSFSSDEYHPELAIDGGGYIHVVWVRADGYLIRTRSSQPGDPTAWGAVLGFQVGEPLATPSIAVSGAGNYAKLFIAVGWSTINWDWLQYEWTLLFLYSTNGGQTVNYDYFLPDGYEDLWPDVAMDSGTVHFINAEADPYTGEVEILIATDTYDGCFCDPGSLSGWTSNNTGFPRVVCQGDAVYTVFQLDYSDGLSTDGDVIYIYSWDAGATFFGPYGMIADEYESVGPAIFAHEGIVGCLWLDGPPGADEFTLAGRMGSGFGHIDMFGDVETVSDQPRVEPQFHSCAGAAASAGAAAAWIDRRDYPTQGHNVYTSRRGLSPDLSPFTPAGWDSFLTVSMERGGRTAEWLAAGDTTFVSFAFMNGGLADITGEFDLALDLDGAEVAVWTLGGSMPAGSYFPLEDHPLIVGPGEHTLTVRLDAGGAIAEIDETDNTFARTFTWLDGDPVLRLEPASFTMVIGLDKALVDGLAGNPPVRREVHLPVVSERLQTATVQSAAGELLRVVIVPAERLDPAAMTAALKTTDLMTASPGVRRAAVLDAARTVAQRQSRELAPVLDDLVRRGLARPARTYWSAQVTIAEMTAEGVAALAGHPSVGRLWLDDLKSETFGGTATQAAGTEASGADKALAWHLQTIGAPEAWGAGFDGDGVLVGHIDTGICYDHPDLYRHMWDGGAAHPNHGYDAIDLDNDPYDGDPDWHHGTHTSGLIVGDGTAGTACGSAPGATLMALRAVPGYFEDLVAAEQFGLDNGVEIFSMSAGWSNAPDDVRAANRYNSELFLSVDISLIAAAGNGDGYGGHYALPTDIASPGDCPNPWYAPNGGPGAVITVGGIKQDLSLSPTSSYGPTSWDVTNPFSTASYRDYPFPPGLQKPDVAAPGELILSCSGDYGYVVYTGTSMACPQVTGAACILMQANPGITPAQIAELLETTAVDLSASPASAGRDDYTGAGLIDIPAALALAPTEPGDPVWIHNDGVMPLRLSEVYESAPWLEVAWPTSAIAPGDSAKLELSFDVAAVLPGIHATTVVIVGNDPVNAHFLPVTLVFGEDVSGVQDGPPAATPSTLAGHPNPFNPRTVLRYTVAGPGHVRLEIYDVRGRMVRTLVDEFRVAGDQQVVWDGQDDQGRSAPSRTYQARLQKDGAAPMTGKLMLVR